jgi:hypothetical protein
MESVIRRLEIQSLKAQVVLCHRCCSSLHCQFKTESLTLGDHLKTGHTLSVQNRPTGLAEDVIVLPRRSVFGQGVV